MYKAYISTGAGIAPNATRVHLVHNVGADMSAIALCGRRPGLDHLFIAEPQGTVTCARCALRMAKKLMVQGTAAERKPKPDRISLEDVIGSILA
jgi:hypothetical protein